MSSLSDLHQTITDKVIAALEAGTPPWVPPWKGGIDGVPRNLTSRRPYRGINVLLLNLTACARGFPDHRWMTFRQAAELGANVRKGERGTPIIFFKMAEVAGAPKTEDASGRVVPLMRSFVVFNAAQLENLPARHQQTAVIPWDPRDEAEAILHASGAEIRHGGSEACYRPSIDVIQMPPREAFFDAEGYYTTALHELTHWTSAPNRCNRPIGMRHGIEPYAFEELIAEMGSAFLAAHCGLPCGLHHASYIHSWLNALRNDKRLVFVAAAKAQAAADFVLAKLESLPGPMAAVAA